MDTASSNEPTSLPRAKGITLRAALIFNIALLTVVIGALSAWLVTIWGAQDIRDREGVRLSAAAHSVARQISLLVDERMADVEAVRDLFEHELAGASGQQQRHLLERTQTSFKYFSWMGVVGPDGEVRVGTEHLLEGKSVAGRSWFEGALKQAAFFGNIHQAKLLAPYIRNPDGTPLYLLDIALPLHGQGGKVTGVVGSHLNWKMIEEVVSLALATTAINSRLSAAVVSADGTILYDTQGATGNVSALMPRGEASMVEVTWPGEVDSSYVLAVLTPPNRAVSNLGWRVVVRESAPAVNAGITQMKWQVFAGSLLVGLLFSGLGWLAVRVVTQPINVLEGDITRFGETETLLPGGNARERIIEVANLRGAFQRMAANVMAHKELLEDTQREIVRSLARAGEFRDNETGNHVFRMSLCSQRLAELAGLSQDRCEMIQLASTMHDLGKIGIPDNVLLKPGRFDDAERAIMEQHSEIGARILAGVETPLTDLARSIAISHHEKWDGTGYPNRLAAADIPLEGRITAICDVFDALLSSRPYKQGWSLDKVEAFMREQAGQHFDPTLVGVFLEHLQDFVDIREHFRDETTDGV